MKIYWDFFFELGAETLGQSQVEDADSESEIRFAISGLVFEKNLLYTSETKGITFFDCLD